MEEPPKYVMLKGSIPNEPQSEREPDCSVAFRAGAYEVFQDRREQDAYRMLRLDLSVPRLKDCMGLIGMSYGCDMRRRMADVYVRISRVGSFKVVGLDAQLLGVVGRIFKGGDGRSDIYCFPSGNHVSVNVVRSSDQIIPQLVIPEDKSFDGNCSLEAQLDHLLRARNRLLREGGVWQTM